MKALRFVALVLAVVIIASAALSLFMGVPASALPSGILSLLPVVLLVLLPVLFVLQVLRWLVSRAASR